MRPLGTAADLDLDFDAGDRPGLVTALLAHCSEAGDEPFWWSQPVGARTAALLRIVIATERHGEMALRSRCGADECGEVFEFSLPLRLLAGNMRGGEAVEPWHRGEPWPADGVEVPADAADARNDPVQVRLGERRTLSVRRPTGRDLRRWREARPASRDEAIRAMLDTIVVDGRADPDDEPAVSAALGALDPLVDFSVACQCPACGTAAEVIVDLEALALARLKRCQQAILHDIHRLASAYGWSEADAIAIPPARRARYLAIIEDGR